ncbi:L,D-transpeptidase family protein [Paracoccus aminovorans]|uniref:L,D-transpeptidase family protein n=1 Tax=Paracoccus aminovorans TaxID=34004 RepID=UPI000784AA67|nr:L,D-transpeptidase family protein [Paracoccus aminovorans]MDQ7775711.1 L,D-transpeptidase family protein [Paracoccus aminovorans]
MKRLGGLFSALCLAALVWGLWVLWAPQPVPPQVPPPAQGWHWPRLPDWRLPEWRLPRLPPILPRPPARPEAPIASPVARILVEKSARRMTVWQRQGGPRSFRIALGFAPEGDKSRQGDGRTPEGIFRIDRVNRQSAYHLSLGLDYPQRHHREAARRGGYDPGGDIMIHGQPNQVPDGYKVKGDWTAGCIAITNAEIEEIFAHAAIGTEVEIRP